VKETIMAVEDNTGAVVRAAFEGLHAGNVEPLRGMLAPDAQLHQCGFLHPISLSRLLDGNFSIGGRFQNRAIHVEHVVTEGDLVALHWRTTGRYVDPSEPDLAGVPVDVPSMTFIRLADGLVAEVWNIQATSTLSSQLDAYREAAQTGRP
jgi:hypothetical protein